MRADPYTFKWRYFERLTGQKEREPHLADYPNGMSFEEAQSNLKFFGVFWQFSHEVVRDDERHHVAVRDEDGILAAEAWLEEVES